MVRLPDGMRDRIADAAKASNRSMNAEIVARLQKSYEASDTPSVANSIADFRAHVSTLLAARDEQVSLLEKYFKRATYALIRAVHLLQQESAPPAKLKPLVEDLAGLRYFLEVVEERIDPDNPDGDDFQQEEPGLREIELPSEPPTAAKRIKRTPPKK
ncbi:MAG: hypothetical protein JWR21_870 [Herminiimonas sp.]|nr:hypothetical protein [Herminiimonas sp.]